MRQPTPSHGDDGGALGTLNGAAPTTDAEIRAVIRHERSNGAGPIVIR